MTGGLERARAAFARRAWIDARALLLDADARGVLQPADLELLAVASDFVGEPTECDAAWERAFHAWLQSGDQARGVRCAFWLGMHLSLQDKRAQAGGWLRRAARVLEESGLDCAEHGYLHLPGALRDFAHGDVDSAATAFAHADRIGTRFADPDLTALARMGLGRCRLAAGEVAAGLALLDEVMVGVLAGETSPVTTGIVYCTTIIVCQEIFDLKRTQEWTAALDDWSRPQQGLVPFRGQCLVHRSEVRQLRGRWPEALAEARLAVDLLDRPHRHPTLGMAWRQLADLHRLRGEFDEAERAYREAGSTGPGLALLRLAQGRVDDAYGSIRRVLAEARGPAARWPLLAALAEIALAAKDVPAAREAADELTRAAEALDAPVLHATAGAADGAVLLAEGQAAAACEPLRQALAVWQEHEAPYQAARVRVLLASACRVLGDADAAEQELDAASAIFRELQAVPDLERLRTPRAAGSLTARETEVLVLAAAGRTNREIAAELVLSEHTVRRHLQNVFGKIGVSSRAAATAYAYQHDLIPRPVMARTDHGRRATFGTPER